MKQIAEDIKQNTFRQAYLLFGEERYLRKQYRDKLMKALCPDGDTMNTHLYEGKDIPVGEIIDLAETMPFLAERRVIFITDSGLFKSGGEKMAEYLAEPNASTIFIFTESEVDKRSKLFKAVGKIGYVSEFTVQDENTLKRWIGSIISKENKQIRESTVQLFLQKTGTDMNNIQMELEKLLCYTMNKSVIEDADVEEICTARIANHIFDMMDAIGNKQKRRAMELYYDLLSLKEPPLRVLFLIGKHCNQLLQVRELKSKGHDNRVIATKMGIPPFAVNKLSAQASKFKGSVLKNAVEKCVEAEAAVKSGQMNEKMSVEILILNVL